MKIELSLSYPKGLSVNAIWKPVKYKMILNPKAKKYKDEMYFLIRQQYPKNDFNFGSVPLTMCISIYPPDNRVRDIDNVAKIILDALQYSKVYDNDNQIQKLIIERKEIKKPKGLLLVCIESLKD